MFHFGGVKIKFPEIEREFRLLSPGAPVDVARGMRTRRGGRVRAITLARVHTRQSS